MQISDYSFQQLPFSKLFKTYVSDYKQLSDFYTADPFDNEDLAKKIKNHQFSGDRQQTVEILTSFNKQFEVAQASLDNLDRLKDNNALTLVTGQQLGIYGGPLYTFLKIISTIHLADKLERQFNCPVIPVFWLADEDHDFDEVRNLHVLNRDKLADFSLPPLKNHLPTVSKVQLGDEHQQFRRDLKESLYDTDFSDDLWDILDECFKQGRTFLEAFGLFISRLFSKHGLVLAGSNHPEIKKATADVIKQSILQADDIRQNLEAQSQKIGEKFHQQVTLYDSNLFYLDAEAGRTKISRNGSGWKTDSGEEWKTEQLVEEIDGHPEKFSPNVFLRPVLQDVLLPTLGYVGGPGETAYYGQMKNLYSSFNLDMPVIFPRLSGTLIEPAIDRIISELPFDFHEYANRIEDLESGYVDRTDQHDIEKLFNDWKQKVEQLAKPNRETISDIDPTLDGAAGKATAVYLGELDKLKGKVYRAVKKRDEIQLKRIRRIKANLFPGDGLQERVIAGIFYMNKYGLDLWDELLESLDENEQFDHHKLIYL